MNTRLLLALSLALNAGLGTLLILLTASRMPTTDTTGQTARESQTAETRGTATGEPAAATEPAPDYRRLFAALRATGLPREETESILRGTALSDWQDDLRNADTDFFAPQGDPAALRESIELRRAREAALADVTEEEEFLVLPGWLIGPDAWDAVAPEKRKAVILLEEDYQLLLADAAPGFRGGFNENDILHLLQEERLQDLATILTENELADYVFAGSSGFAPPAAADSTAAIANHPAPTEPPGVAADPVFQELRQLAERFDLSPERAAEVYELRRVVLEQREELAADPELSREEREGALQLLTGDARDVVREILGDDGFEAYLETGGGWLEEPEEADDPPEIETP